MKNALKSLSFLMVLGTLIFITSCGDDDGGGIIIDDGDGGSFVVADGMYIAGISGTDTTIVNAAKLSAAVVEDVSFGSQDRDGFVRAWVYLTAGNYVIAEVADQEVVSVYGGTATTETVDPSNADLGPDEYQVIALEANGSTFSVANEGVHFVSFDNLTDEALLVEIGDWGVLGGSVYKSVCEGVGFSDDVTLTKGATSADGTTWSATGVIMRTGEVKFRMDDVWKIDRRTDQSNFDEASGYVTFLNVGGTLENLVEGGANIAFTDDNAGGGLYDVTLSLSDNGEFSATLSRTGDAEACSFDPANFPWGIIGAATQGIEGDGTDVCDGGTKTIGWSHEKKFFYSGESDGTHYWRGVFPLAGGADSAFKFRADCGWTNKLIPTNVTVTDNTEMGTITNDGDTNPDGQWFVADGFDGFYYMIISTADQGSTWSLTIDEASIGVVGNGSPAGAWPDDNNPSPDVALTYNDDLASLSITGDFTTDTWKIRVNQSWDLNFGGALDGSALNFNGFGDDLTVPSAGNYTLTLTTGDGGVTFTGSATDNSARQ